ncbi:MAG: right-handed parallel beta-helix repeat-containing protein, partial [Solirubrobacteraceae bacterium]
RLSILSSTITGEGPCPSIAQIGVLISFGGAGEIMCTTIWGNECNVASCGATGEQAAGVLLYEAAAGSSVVSSTVKENDNGLYYITGSATQPSSPDATLTKNMFTSNRYEGIALDQGKAELKNDTVNGTGLVGIILYQYAAQTLASESVSSKTTISGQSQASILVSSDKAAGDIKGKFTFSKGSAAEPKLVNESSNFEVTF